VEEIGRQDFLRLGVDDNRAALAVVFGLVAAGNVGPHLNAINQQLRMIAHITAGSAGTRPSRIERKSASGVSWR
jgi:hypothetical protein